MTATTYRLRDRRRTISRGPLALVAGQAHRSALAGKPLVISDAVGNTVVIGLHRGVIWPIWQQPQELFPAPDIATQPDWYCRLLALIVALNDDHQPAGPTSGKFDLPPTRNEPHNTLQKEQT